MSEKYPKVKRAENPYDNKVEWEWHVYWKKDVDDLNAHLSIGRTKQSYEFAKEDLMNYIEWRTKNGYTIDLYELIKHEW